MKFVGILFIAIITMFSTNGYAQAAGLPQSCKNIIGSTYKIAKSMGSDEMKGINSPAELQAKMEKEWAQMSSAEQGRTEAECRQAEVGLKKIK